MEYGPIFSIASFGAACGLGRSSVYKLISEGKLKTVKVGSRRLILDTPLSFLERQMELQSATENRGGDGDA